MKKGYKAAAAVLAAALFLGGCSAADPNAERKTEAESVTVGGMFSQQLDRNVTYVMKDGQWAEESAEVTGRDIAEGYDIQDTVWIITNSDAKSIIPQLDAKFYDETATVYIHFGTDLQDMKTEVTGSGDAAVLKATFSVTADLVFQCMGAKSYFNDVKVSGADIKQDGSAVLKATAGSEEYEINVPADVTQAEWEDYLKFQSSTYITSIPFSSLPTFEVTSSCLNKGIWDTKITNTDSGDNISPDLTWEPVDGASQYVVIMIDGSWLHMDVFTTETSLAEGAYGAGSKGEQYVGPYPPKGNPHTYTVFVFALAEEPEDITLLFDSSGNMISSIYDDLDTGASGNTGNVIAYGRLDGNFTLY